MTLRERLGLPVPPKPDAKPEPVRPFIPEWVKRAQEHRLPVQQRREGTA